MVYKSSSLASGGGGGGSGTVTTTGSPIAGELVKFSGSTSITNGDLSGDVTTSSTLSTNIAAIQGRIVAGTSGVSNVIFSDNATLNNTTFTGTQSITTSGNISCGGNIGISGAINSGAWQATPVAVQYGGTGQNTLTSHSVLIGEGTSNVSFATTGVVARILIDQGNADPAFEAITGDISLLSTGATTVLAVHGVTYPSSPGTNTVPVVTSSNTITYEAVPNAALANSSITIGAQTGLAGGGSVALGSAITLSMGTSTANTLAGYNSSGVFSDVSIGTNLNLVSGVLGTSNFSAGNNITITYSTNTLGITASGGGAVSSVFGRTGAVSANWNDYQFNLIGGVASVSQGGTGLQSGTSGGIPYYSGTTTIASSALLSTGQIITGGGSGGSPTVASQGTFANVPAGPSQGQIYFATSFGSVGSSTGMWITFNGTNWKPFTGVGIIYHSAVKTASTSSASEVNLATVAIPAGLLSANGGLRIFALGGGVGQFEVKTYTVRYGANSGSTTDPIIYSVAQASATRSIELYKWIGNRNATNSQVTQPTGQNWAGSNTNTNLTLSAATSSITYLNFNGNVAVGANSIAYDAIQVEWLEP